jgi:hypothetical protein
LNGEDSGWDWETTLRLLKAQTHYPSGCNNYNTVCRYELERWTHQIERSTLPVSSVPNLRYPIERDPTGPPDHTSQVTRTEHTGMWSTTDVSFIDIIVELRVLVQTSL